MSLPSIEAPARRNKAVRFRESGETFVDRVTVTSAQVLALFATPQTIVASPGDGYYIELVSATIYKAAGTAYAGVAAGEDLFFGLGSSSIECARVETTGFVDQATAQTRHVNGRAGTAAVADFAPTGTGMALVMGLLVGEITTGDSDLKVEVRYRVHQTSW